MLSQCNRRNHPVADSDGLQVVEDLCETPPSPDGDPVAALFRRKAVWTTLDPNLVVIQYVGDISTAVSGLNNFVSCDVVQDSSEIVIDETPKEEMVEMTTEANVTTPDVSTEAEVERNPQVRGLPRNSNEVKETAKSEDEPEVVDLSDDDDDEMANVPCQPKAQQVLENVFGIDSGKSKAVQIKPLPKLPAGLQVRGVYVLGWELEKKTCKTFKMYIIFLGCKKSIKSTGTSLL